MDIQDCGNNRRWNLIRSAYDMVFLGAVCDASGGRGMTDLSNYTGRPQQAPIASAVFWAGLRIGVLIGCAAMWVFWALLT
jgi:hypothetical protein